MQQRVQQPRGSGWQKRLLQERLRLQQQQQRSGASAANTSLAN
jgi:hypothetical protein